MIEIILRNLDDELTVGPITIWRRYGGFEIEFNDDYHFIDVDEDYYSDIQKPEPPQETKGGGG